MCFFKFKIKKNNNLKKHVKIVFYKDDFRLKILLKVVFPKDDFQ